MIQKACSPQNEKKKNSQQRKSNRMPNDQSETFHLEFLFYSRPVFDDRKRKSFLTKVSTPRFFFLQILCWAYFHLDFIDTKVSSHWISPPPIRCDWRVGTARGQKSRCFWLDSWPFQKIICSIKWTLEGMTSISNDGDVPGASQTELESGISWT